jgi:hypothetical protein
MIRGGSDADDADAPRRLALALVLEGYKRGEAGKLCGIDRQTLRDWVLRSGLCNHLNHGSPQSRRRQ